MSVTDALQKLSEAHGASALASAFRALQGQVKRARKAASGLGPLAQTFTEAMRIWDAQKAEGVEQAERVAGLEKSLRAAWPFEREWKYLCQHCDDTGWTFRTCTQDNPCRRPFKLQGAFSDDYTGRGRCTDGHTFCAPCNWCDKGQTFRRSLEHTKAKPEDFTQATRSKPTRVGR